MQTELHTTLFIPILKIPLQEIDELTAAFPIFNATTRKSINHARPTAFRLHIHSIVPCLTTDSLFKTKQFSFLCKLQKMNVKRLFLSSSCTKYFLITHWYGEHYNNFFQQRISILTETSMRLFQKNCIQIKITILLSFRIVCKMLH